VGTQMAVHSLTLTLFLQKMWAD